MGRQVFISYSSKDKVVADAVCASLEAAGVTCWIAPRDILPGVHWSEAIINAIQDSLILALVLSSNSSASQQVLREVERAANRGITILPFRIEDVPLSKTLEYFISSHHWLDAFAGPMETHLDYLVRTVQVLLPGIQAERTHTDNPTQQGAGTKTAAGLDLPQQDLSGTPPTISPDSGAASTLHQDPTQPDLPSGTITFLFTDIQGSTRLWEQEPAAMRLAHGRHCELVIRCVERHGGIFVRTRGEGDSTFSVFQKGSEAVAAACDFQRALHAETWPTKSPIRVRAALHSGAGAPVGGDYNNSAVNRCARLRSIAYGGQTLLSQAAYELALDEMPEGVTIRDMGSHRLKDLQRPEQVYQLLHPDLPSEFPPLLSVDSLPNNLPQQLTSFIGREKDIKEVKRLLGSASLVTLIGTGGLGKTRLALQAAADLLEEYRDGAWLVELAPLSDPSLAAQTVASELGVREEPGRSILQTLTDHLKSKSLLLVLDNCEHLVEASARLADTLLRACPRLKILATSREPLGIGGELSYRVPPLSLPDPQRLALPGSALLYDIGQYEAVRLFIERALYSQSTFKVTEKNAPAIAQICQRLDGIPLALELAAARVKSMPVEQIARRLDDCFRLLTGGSRAALPRQQTLRALIDWSYDLLAENEKLLLQRLSVFMDGWTLAAAEAVCADPSDTPLPHQEIAIEEWEILDLLSQLVNKSLVVYEEEDGEARYRLLETVRQYACERLRETGQGDAIKDRHRDHYLYFACEAEPELTGRDQALWLERLETENDNLRAAMERALETSPEAALDLAGSLWRFWYTRGYLREGRQRLTAALDRAESLKFSMEGASALKGAGNLANRQGDYTAARSLHEESLAIYRDLLDQQGEADALNNLGNVACRQEDYARARTLFEESLVIERELGNERGIADSLNNLGAVAYEQRDFDAARAYFEESLALGRAMGNVKGIAMSLYNLGSVAREQGDYITAQLRQAESLPLARDLRDKPGIANTLEELGALAVLEGDPDRAARLLGAAECLREMIGSAIPPSELAEHDRSVELSRAAMGEAAFAAAWQAGRALPLDQAIACALQES